MNDRFAFPAVGRRAFLRMSAAAGAAAFAAPTLARTAGATTIMGAPAGQALMTRQQILDAISQYSGTRITASLIGSSLPPQALFDELRAVGIETDVTPTPATQLFEKLIIDFAGGASTFDVISYVVNDVGAFAQFLLDLGPLNVKYGWPEQDVMSAFRNYGWYPDRISGQQFGLPYDGDFFLLHYRKDAFAAAGLDPNRPPQTYDELLQYAQQLNGVVVDGQRLTGFTPRTRRALNHTWWANFFAAWGGDWFTEDWRPNINTIAGVESLAYAVRLLDFGPPNAADLGFLDVNRMWTDGETAMSMHYQTMGTTAQFDRTSRVSGKVAMAELPAGPAGRRAGLVGGQVLGIPAYSRNAEAAYLWSRWFTHPENVKRTSLLGTGVEPVYTSVFADAEFQAGFGDGQNGWMAEWTQANNPILALPNIAEWNVLQEVLDLNLSQAYLKQKTPEQAMADTSAAWIQTLGRAGYYTGNRAPYNRQG